MRYHRSFVGTSICLAGIFVGLGVVSMSATTSNRQARFVAPRLGSQDAASLEGSWSAREYVLATGARHSVRGRILFTEGDWQVLFFVMDDGAPKRGSAEGGRYTFDGKTLTFEHLHHLSIGDEMDGLPASSLTMTARADDGPLEPTGVRLTGNELTLDFPSGNTMSFVRSSVGR